MAGFCIYCGKPLENGMCSCNDFRAAQQQQMAAQQQAMQQQMAQQQAMQQQAAQQQMWQGMPQGNGQPNLYAGGMGQSAYSQNMKAQLSNSKSMFFDFIKSPISMMSKVYTGADKTTAILMGAFHLLIFMLICLIRIPMLGFGDKLGIGFKIDIGVAAFVLLHAFLSFGIAKYRHVPVDVVSVIGIFCVATIPSSIFVIGALVTSYVSWVICGLCLIIGFLAWIVLSIEAIKVTLQADRDTVFWIIILIMALVTIITGLVAKQIVIETVMKAAMGAGNMFGGLF